MPKTILVIEDDTRILKMTKDILEMEGYTAIGAIDGRQGLEFARTIRPDIIIMDILLPYKDGYTACTEIKKDTDIGKTPVIMMSALDAKLNITLAKRLGADGYITKPFTRKDLVTAIEPYLLVTASEKITPSPV